MRSTTNTHISSKTFVNSHKELLSIIKHSIEQYNEIRLVELIITFKVDTYSFYGKKGIPMDLSTDTILVDYPVIIDGVECEELVFNKVSFNKDVTFSITSKSKIGRLFFYDCFFKSNSQDSLEILQLLCNEFDMNNCISNASIIFDLFDCKESFNIEDVNIKGGLVFRNFRLLPKDNTEMSLGGQVEKDVKFFNCTLFKKTIVNVNTNGSIMFDMINYDMTEGVDNSSIILRQGELCMNGTTIREQLMFSCCNIGIIDFINVTVESVLEYELRYKRLKHQSAIILRNGANKRDDEIAYIKYTADMYDNCLRSNCTRRLYKWIHRLDSNSKKDLTEFKKIERKHKWKNIGWKIVEPFWLFVTNVFSEEGILLFFNKYSNNYNRSWSRGVVFTCATALLAYFVINYCGMQQQYFVIDWRFNGFGDVFIGYLSLLDIFNLIGGDKPVFDLTPFGKGLMLFFKILIAYGVWQTIYAFYKYKK